MRLSGMIHITATKIKIAPEIQTLKKALTNPITYSKGEMLPFLFFPGPVLKSNPFHGFSI